MIKLDRGFTLVETLVALTLLSLVSVAVFSAVRSSFRISEAAEQQVSRNQDLRLVASFLDRAVRGLVPLTSVDRGKRLPHVQGSAEALTLVVDGPPRFRAGGLQEVRIAQEKPQEGRGIIYTSRLVHPDLMERDGSAVAYVDEAPDDERVLLRDAKFVLAYFGRASPRAEPRWHDEWDGKRGAPILVRMRIEQAWGTWPDIVARPQVQRVRYQSLRGGARDLNDESPDVGEAPELPASPADRSPGRPGA